ncbi:MAG: hypothetical protein KAS32_05925 [Candidatus Peribacteraceae bacterium]|nr:hypothetical protein [Candidatus Peribacteraceae bacterium]
MKRTFLQQQIEGRAEERLDEEWKEVCRLFWQNPLLKDLEIGKETLKGQYNEHMDRVENKSLVKIIEKRRKALIAEETKRVLDKLDGMEYLFKKPEDREPY